MAGVKSQTEIAGEPEVARSQTNHDLALTFLDAAEFVLTFFATPFAGVTEFFASVLNAHGSIPVILVVNTKTLMYVDLNQGPDSFPKFATGTEIFCTMI